MLARLSALVARRAAAPASLRRALCAPPAPPVVLMETPAVSTRKARIREHGMLGLTTAFIEQQSTRGRDASFPSASCARRRALRAASGHQD